MPQWQTDVEDVEEAVFDQIMAVNVKGVYLGAKYALPVMKRQRRGVFLITASTSAIRPRPGRPGATRPPRARWSRMAKAWRSRPRRTACGWWRSRRSPRETPMLPTFMGKTEVDEEGLTRYIATVPLGRLNKPEDLASAPPSSSPPTTRR